MVNYFAHFMHLMYLASNLLRDIETITFFYALIKLIAALTKIIII